MAARLYSTRFMSGEIVGAASIDYEVPDGWVIVVRNVTWSIAGGLDASCTLAVTLEGVSPLQWNLPSAFTGSDTWEGRMVAPGPTTLTFASTGSGEATVQVNVSGYLLTP